MKIKLVEGYFITNIDEKNWALCEEKPKKNGKGLAIKQLTFHATLPEALKWAAHKMVIDQKTIGGAVEILNQLEKIINTIIKNENALRNIKDKKSNCMEEIS